MKILKKELLGRVVGGVLGCLAGIISVGSLTFETKNINSSQITNCYSKKQSEQLFRTKTDKCYRRSHCPCLKNSKIKVNQDEIEKAELNSCSKCCKKSRSCLN